MDVSPLHYQTLIQVSERIRRQEMSSADVTAALLQRIAALDGQCHSYATVLNERALDQARRADLDIAKSGWRGPLHGVPIAVKDLCYTSFAPTTAGTTIYSNWIPDFTSTVVEGSRVASVKVVGIRM